VLSKDGGATWTAPATVNSEGLRDQFFPSVAITPDGKKLMFSYYSRAQDPNNMLFHRQGREGSIRATGSIGLNPSFQMGPNTPVVIGQDPVINTTYMGDYDQTVADATSFHNTWSDNRDGNSFHQFQPDVRYARITAVPASTDIVTNISPASANVNVGTTTQLTVSVTATGGPARDTFVNLSPVAGLTYTAVIGAQCRLIQGFVGCSLGNLADGTTKTFKVNVFAGLPAGTRTVKAQATTSSRDTTTADDTGTSTLTVSGSGTTSTYSTGNIAVPIPDVSTVEVPLNVPDVGGVLKAQALVRLDHTFDSDLRISLVSPGGTPTVVTLSNRHGGSGDNYGSGANDCSGTPTTFNDSAATPISAGAPPFDGTFRPDAPLSAVNGLPSAGAWKLRVEDLAAADVGTIGCFKLKITHG
jgi:subtilisin-like proprotein convertase family protein